jgi:hypothetical protein
MNAFRVKFSSLHYFFNFCDDAMGSLGHVLVEVSFGHLELQVSLCVSSFGLDDGEVSEESLFSNVFFAIEVSSFFRFRNNFRFKIGLAHFHCLVTVIFFEFDRETPCFDHGSDSRRSIEGWNPCSSRPDPLS